MSTAWFVSFPIAIYSATHQYSLTDYFVSFLGFFGLATPSFLLALVLNFFVKILEKLVMPWHQDQELREFSI